MPILIRKATPKDFAQLNQIKQEFFLWECKLDKRCNPAYAKKGLGSRLAQNLKQTNTVFFIALNKGEIIGYVGAEIKKNPVYIKFKERGHLFNIYVRPAYQGRGIGKKLINETMKWFKKKGLHDLMILVHDHNKKAHRIYNKNGFDDYIIELKKII
jgi:ribosomal protein S18 acetylase RimI-like enzyme